MEKYIEFVGQFDPHWETEILDPSALVSSLALILHPASFPAFEREPGNEATHNDAVTRERRVELFVTAYSEGLLANVVMYGTTDLRRLTISPQGVYRKDLLV